MRIEQHIDIEASPQRLWQVIGPGFTDVDTWASAIAHSEPTPSGDGRACTVSGPPAIKCITERLTAYDDAARSLTYAAEAGLPRYVLTARSTWRVQPLGPTRSRAWVCAEVKTSAAARITVPVMHAAIRMLGRRTLRELKHYVEHGVPAPRKQQQAARRTTHRSPGAGDPARLLTTSVRCNAVFSATSGLLLLGTGFRVDTALGVDAWALTGLGGGLCLFAAVLLWLLIHTPYLDAGARFALAADVGWVVGALVLLAGFPSVLTSTGKTALVGVTAIVAAIAAGEAFGVHRIGDTRHGWASPIVR